MAKKIVTDRIAKNTGSTGSTGTHLSPRNEPSTPESCLNCGATLTGKYCAVCGQTAYVQRSLLSLGHDFLHGVFHLEGRVWHTIPELFFRPGRLTRRYIDGERAKFIAPLPLFLFCVFFMFGVFWLTSSDDSPGRTTVVETIEQWHARNAGAISAINTQIDELRIELNSASTAPKRRAEINNRIVALESSRAIVEKLTTSDWARFAKRSEEKEPDRNSIKIKFEDGPLADDVQSDNEWGAALRAAQQNPGLALYKAKTNIYKFSWALIPMSIPFMWLLFFWRRDIHLYDHAVFITYSLSFMMLLLVILNVAATLGLPDWAWTSVFSIAAPLHLYKQLGQTFALSRGGAFIRLVLLAVFIFFIILLFTGLLFVLGILA